MKKQFVSSSQESVRMFKRDWMEALSKVHFMVPIIIFVPAILNLTWRSLYAYELNFLLFISYAVLGLFTWTFIEYVLHRFVFHYVPDSDWGKRLHFIFHGVHHDYPNDTKRLVMPPAASIPMALLLYYIFSLILSGGELYAFFAAFLGGYLFYDISHYAIHHFHFKSTFWKELRKHHMLHHYADATKGYGVSSSFWDKVFRSDFKRK